MNSALSYKVLLKKNFRILNGDERSHSRAIRDLEDSWRTANDIVDKYPEYGRDDYGQALYIETHEKYKKVLAPEH